MLGRVTVPILPFQRRGQTKIDQRAGAVVTVYNAMGNGAPAVREDGVVDPLATTAYVYTDRAGSGVISSAVTCDEFGGPLDGSRPGPQDTTSFTFYGFPGVYHLLVVMPDGKRFGICLLYTSPSPRDA